MRKAVFLDRDGVINVDKGYVHRVQDFRFIPGSFRALRRLKAAGFLCVLITDQSGIGRGYYSKQDTERVHKHMQRCLARHGALLDEIYYCPHAPEAGCSCRKPKPGLVRQATKEHSIAPAKSYFVGDKRRDIQTGKNARCKTVLVLTGKAGKDPGFDVEPDFIAKDLKEAADLIVKNERQDQDS